MSENTPFYDDTLEQASELLRQAIPWLARHGIAPSPLNYRLAYDYVAGRGEALQNQLDTRLEAGNPLSAEELWEIYRQFFLPDFEAMEKVRRELRGLVARIQDEFSVSGDHLSEYAQTLEHFAQILGDRACAGEVASETRRVISRTRSVEEHHRHLESDIASVMTEVEGLRRELELVKKESLTDALTGIANRKAFDQALGKALCGAAERRTPLGLLMIDIDRFKDFNDTHGHLVGDKVLRFVASVLRRCLKGMDTAARFGGEEFAVILPDTAMIGAEAVAQQIRRAIAGGELADELTGQRYGRVTVSIGVAQARWNEQSADLLRRADQALYRAKARGRDRVEKAI